MAPAMATASRAADGGYGPVSTPAAAAALRSDFKSLLADVRKGLLMIKSVATDLEKENRPDLVSELEEAVIRLLDTSDTSDDCSRRAVGIAIVREDRLKPTNFKKLLMEDELAKIKKDSPSTGKSNPFIRQFKEAVWNVHQAGQPMPGEELEEIVMTNTQCNLLNTTCPLSGKPVSGLEEPVRK